MHSRSVLCMTGHYNFYYVCMYVCTCSDDSRVFTYELKQIIVVITIMRYLFAKCSETKKQQNTYSHTFRDANTHGRGQGVLYGATVIGSGERRLSPSRYGYAGFTPKILR